MQRPTVRPAISFYSFKPLSFCPFISGQTTTRRQPHSLRQESKLPNHWRRPLRPLRTLREHTADTHRERGEDEGDGVCGLWRRHGCTF